MGRKHTTALTLEELRQLDLFSDVPEATLAQLLEAHPAALQTITDSFYGRMESLKGEVEHSTELLKETQYEIIFRLGRAAEFRDDDTGIHITRMSRFAARVALEIGMDEERTELLLHAAPMHDIGKIGIADGILLKPGKLTDEEFDTMKTHTEIGAELLAGSNSPVVQLAQQVALSHHEKWNGSGYPEGLEGENIPLEARICCVVDVFDALISERPYKQPWSVDDALAEIKKCGGTMFDPELADVFVKLEDDVRDILERTAAGSSLPAVSRSATMYFLTQQAGATP